MPNNTGFSFNARLLRHKFIYLNGCAPAFQQFFMRDLCTLFTIGKIEL